MSRARRAAIRPARRATTGAALRAAIVVLASVLSSACATSQSRMSRALEPSMERVLVTETYLRTVTGLSSYPERLMRNDGYVYVADVAPVMRYYADRGDTLQYLRLRSYMMLNLMRRDAAGFTLGRRFRAGQEFERARPDEYSGTRRALLEGWQALGDTTSATVLAQLVPVPQPESPAASAQYQLSVDCADALELVSADPAPARAVLTRARALVGRDRGGEAGQRVVGATASDDEVDLLACLTRAGVALNDPDASVRYLDRMLSRLQPFLAHSGRTDLGTGADVLLTLHRVREAGPAWSLPPARGAR